MASTEVEDDLDDLLESALDGFTQTAAQSQSSGEKAADASSQSNSAREGEGAAGPSAEASKGGALGEVKGLGMPALGKKKGKKAASSSKSRASDSAAQKGASGEERSTSGGSSSDRGRQKSGAPKGPALTDTLEQLAERTRQTVEGMKAPEPVPEIRGGRAAGEDGEATGEEEEMMEKLAKQFEDMGTQDIQGLMDTMLQQLLSKEVLHEPMVEIRNRYPGWLSANSARLAAEDLDRYSRQYEVIQRLCRLYETNPEDFSAILAVMKEMQECGQPPAEIIQDLAPGLEIGDDGLPLIPDLGSGDLPPNCSVM